MTNWNSVIVVSAAACLATTVETPPYFCDVNESIELGRFVLLDSTPANAESFFFARCRELLQQERIKAVLAFSDDTLRTDVFGNQTFKGHIGNSYHSSNGSYCFTINTSHPQITAAVGSHN